MSERRNTGEWTFDPGEYCDRCRSWFLDQGTVPPPLERYGLRPEAGDAAVRTALEEKPRFWTSRLDSGLGEIFQVFLDEHNELSKVLRDPERRGEILGQATTEIASPATTEPLVIEPSVIEPSVIEPPVIEPPVIELPVIELPVIELPVEDPAAPPPWPEIPPPPPPANVAEPPPPPPPPQVEPIPPPPPADDSARFESGEETPGEETPDLSNLSDLSDLSDPSDLSDEPEPHEDPEPPAEPAIPPPPLPFAEPPVGELEVSYDGERATLHWPAENAEVRIVREILRGEDAERAEWRFDDGEHEAHDDGPAPGTVVRYRLQRRRGGEISPAALDSKPVTFWRPLRDAEAVPGDGEVLVSWSGAEGAESVDVERLDSDGETVPFDEATSPILDRGLQNGKRYTYVIRALYADADGGPSCPDSLRRFARPLPPPPPPTDVEISYAKLKAPDAPRVATLHFPAPEAGETRIYVARTEPEWPPGTAVGHDELERLEGPLPEATPSRPGRRAARHESTRFGVSYYLPVSELGLHRVAGECLLGFDAEVFRRIRIERDDDEDDLRVSWEWPQGSDRVLVLWRYDEPPAGAEDPDAESLLVPFVDFVKGGRFVEVPMPDGEEKIHLLFLAGIPFTYGGEEQVFFLPRTGKTSRATWRPGGRMILRYHVEVGQGYSATSPPESAHLVIELDGPPRPLPEMVLLSHERRKPLVSELDDGDLVALEIAAEPDPRPPIRLAVPLERAGIGYKYNLVFRDRSQYEDWRIERFGNLARIL